MAKILHFPTSTGKTMNEIIEESLENMKKEKPTAFLMACKLEDGSVMTGYFECDPGTRQELVGHIQCDIIDQMILANLDRYQL